MHSLEAHVQSSGVLRSEAVTFPYLIIPIITHRKLLKCGCELCYFKWYNAFLISLHACLGLEKSQGATEEIQNGVINERVGEMEASARPVTLGLELADRTDVRTQ